MAARSSTLLLASFIALVGWTLPTTTSAFRRTPSFKVSSSEQDARYSQYQQDQQQKEGQRNLKGQPVYVKVPTDPSEHLVRSLPLLEDDALDGIQHWSGHLPVQEGDKYLFYWLFSPSTAAGSSQNDDGIPLIIWLNGGPACSSMDGLFLENGPIAWHVDDTTGEYRLEANPYSWNRAPAYTVYIDQPVGTGLSFTTSGTYPRNDPEVNGDFYQFLQQFFTLHADKFVTTKNGRRTVNRPVYFSGESHAGHYIPSMMNHILQRNDNPADASHDAIVIPLAGAAIGNGWIDPYHQYAAAHAAYGHGLIDLAQLYALDAKEDACQRALDRKQYTSGVCFDLLDEVVGQSYGMSSQYKVSQYDVRRSEHKRGERDFPPGYKVTETYLGGWPLPSGEPGTLNPSIQQAVLEALHATAAIEAGQRYQECTDPPYEALAHQDGLGVVDDVVAVLNHPSEPRLLFFNGIQDLICNHVGNEKALEYMPWAHQAEWMAASRYAWVATDRPTAEKPVAGYMREFRNLMYLKLFDAGHMVPLDQPTVALAMMQTLLQEKSFDSSRQSLSNAPQSPDEPDCPVCPTCPACPTCPDKNDDDDDDDDNSNGSSANSSVPPSSSDMWAWMGPLMAVAGGLALVYSCWPSRRVKRLRRDSGTGIVMNGGSSLSSSPATSSPRSLELHERQSSYHDDFDEDKEVL